MEVRQFKQHVLNYAMHFYYLYHKSRSSSSRIFVRGIEIDKEDWESLQGFLGFREEGL